MKNGAKTNLLHLSFWSVYFKHINTAFGERHHFFFLCFNVFKLLTGNCEFYQTGIANT